MLNTPILFLTFNRLKTVKKTFAKIKKIEPKQLFIASDGGRTKEEQKKIDKIRKYILKQINWDCSYKTLFRKENLGCKIAVSEAITWFFDNVKQGIILEDDCLSNNDFFYYCEELLKKYKDDKKIVSICGTNIFGNSKIKDSYLFSRYGASWGWATWKRCWDKYDCNLNNLNFNDIIFKENMKKYDKQLKEDYYNLSIKGDINTWDYQWNITRSILGGFNIIPRTNLIENIGFGEQSTHTKKKLNSLKIGKLKFPLKHPKEVIENLNFGKAFYYRKTIPSVIKLKIRNIIK